MNDIDWSLESHRIVEFIENESSKAGVRSLIVGVSGGIDSAVVASLCMQSRIKTHYYHLVANGIYRAKEPSKIDLDIPLLEKYLGDKIDIISLNDIVKMMRIIAEDRKPYITNVAIGNVAARARMMTLYMFANMHNGLVVGTTNLPEYRVGYTTKFGDGAEDISPIRHLLKREVVELAIHLNIPTSIITRPPSAGLWDGQTDEKEMHITYKELDAMIANEIPVNDRVEGMIQRSEHKRNEAPHLERMW